MQLFDREDEKDSAAMKLQMILADLQYRRDYTIIIWKIEHPLV